ncbi:hypothetical protein LZC95_43085 [Pendulispora brunnea]|uniref:Tetratricopeptide repeat protein n=1 Tax=Pendulispora brunnea TaxID=2905690 RepID=A0ABZ2K3F3_9BACT
MADKGRWSIVNPAGEEVTFDSREDLKRAVLDDEIEPHAESLPPDPPPGFPQAEERPPVTPSNRPTPFMGEAEVLDAEARASVSNGRAAMLPSEGEVADDAEPPSSAGEMMDEPTLQFSRPLSVPPMPSRKSPPEDEASPLSLSEVGGVEAPPSLESFEHEEKSEDDAEDAQDAKASQDAKDAKDAKDETGEKDAKVEKIVVSPDDSVSLTLPLVGPGSLKAANEEKGNDDDDEEDEKTAEMEVEASELETEDGPETLKRPAAAAAVVRETTPPPLPVSGSTADRRSSKPALPPLPASARASVAPPLQRLSPPPRISLKPETLRPVRGSISPPSLPPPDIIPDAPAPAAAAATAPAAVAAAKVEPKSPSPMRKPSWIVPIALVGIGVAFWLSTKSNHVPAPESATKEPKAAETQAPTTESPPGAASPVNAVSSTAMVTPAPSADEAPRAIEPSEPAAAVAASITPGANAPGASSAPPANLAQAPTPPSPASPSPASPSPASPSAATPEKPHPGAPTPAANPAPAGPPGVVIAANDPLGPTLRRAAQVQRNGDYATARQIYQALVQKEPKNPEVLTGLGDTSRALGDKAGARSYYTRALAASSSFLPALLGLADTEWDLGDRAAAQKHYADIVEHHTNAPERARQRAKASVTP